MTSSDTPPAPVGLSVVMPTRNQAAFIRAAVDTVLSQRADLPAPMELVIADGASTDGTVDVLEALSREHPELIRWVSEPDQGPADAVNKAVARARGEVIGWLNSDDAYTPGALARAWQALRQHPDWVMVYGQGEHVDLHGASLGRYPTLPPGTPLTRWRDGCPICQPTAVFRRDAFLSMGGLDTTLRTAFDYEFWLRLFKAYPDRIGFVDAVQALSRLHDAGITLSQREQVAMEGMAVVHRHLGAAPAHWLLTYVDEALARCPFDGDAATLRRRLNALADQALPWLAPDEAATLPRRLREHRTLALARPDLVTDVHADGWAPCDLAIRLRQPTPGYRRLRLWGRHDAPGGAPLSMTLSCDGQPLPWQGGVSRPGRFDLTLPLPAGRDGQDLRLGLHSRPGFVPATAVSGSGDTRVLAFQLDALEPQ